MAARRNISPGEDDRMLAMRLEGRTCRDIAFLCDVSVGTVVAGVSRAKARRKKAAEPESPPAPRQPAWVHEMVPLFPVTPFVPGVACPHHGPIARGSKFVCMVCHRSGMDHRPELRLDPLTAPKPEPKTPAKPKPRSSRRERRRGAA